MIFVVALLLLLLVLCFAIGFALSALVTGWMFNSGAPIWLVILLAVIFGLGVMALFIYGSQVEMDTFNNGIHLDCGGTWELWDVEKSGKYGQITSYIYKCDKCEKVFVSSYQY